MENSFVIGFGVIFAVLLFVLYNFIRNTEAKVSVLDTKMRDTLGQIQLQLDQVRSDFLTHAKEYNEKLGTQSSQLNEFRTGLEKIGETYLSLDAKINTSLGLAQQQVDKVRSDLLKWIESTDKKLAEHDEQFEKVCSDLLKRTESADKKLAEHDETMKKFVFSIPAEERASLDHLKSDFDDYSYFSKELINNSIKNFPVTHEIVAFHDKLLRLENVESPDELTKDIRSAIKDYKPCDVDKVLHDAENVLEDLMIKSMTFLKESFDGLPEIQKHYFIFNHIPLAKRIGYLHESIHKTLQSTKGEIASLCHQIGGIREAFPKLEKLVSKTGNAGSIFRGILDGIIIALSELPLTPVEDLWESFKEEPDQEFVKQYIEYIDDFIRKSSKFIQAFEKKLVALGDIFEKEYRYMYSHIVDGLSIALQSGSHIELEHLGPRWFLSHDEALQQALRKDAEDLFEVLREEGLSMRTEQNIRALLAAS